MKRGEEEGKCLKGRRDEGKGGKGRGGGGTTSPDPSCLCEGSRVLSC